MGYDHDDNFPFDFEPNEFIFGSKSKGKLYYISLDYKPLGQRDIHSTGLQPVAATGYTFY